MGGGRIEMHEITNVKCKTCGKPREGDSYHGLMVCKHKGEAMNWEDELRKLMVKGWYINIDDARIFISSLLKKQAENIADKCGLDCDCGNVGFYVVADNQTGEPVQEQCEYCYTTPYSKFSILSLTEPE